MEVVASSLYCELSIFLISLPETTLKSLISSLSGVIPESDRVSTSYSGSAFRSFVVDVLYSIDLLIEKKNAFVPLNHVTQKGCVYLSFGKLHSNFSKAGVLFICRVVQCKANV